MKVKEFFEKTKLDNGLLIGFYGGGNYGDELLLEVIQNLLQKNKPKNFKIMYQKPDEFETFHHDFGYERVDAFNKPGLLKAMLKSKTIVIGGGGLWGLDFNLNVLLMSMALFFCRLLGKKVYLVGIGYYQSTTQLGHLGAWFAGKAATHIIARDDETAANFAKITSQKKISQDVDIAWNLEESDYKEYVLEKSDLLSGLSIANSTTFITLRRFHPGSIKGNAYKQAVENYINQNQTTPIILSLMEPASADSSNFDYIQTLARNNKNVQAIDFSYNPLSLLLFFKKNREKLRIISPQFHVIITAKLAGVSFFPMAYDNKVDELLRMMRAEKIHTIENVTVADLTEFAKT